MTNEERIAEIKEWIDQLSFDRCQNGSHPGVVYKVQLLLQMISEYEARIAAYELEIKELKGDQCPDCPLPLSAHPPGSTLLSESQHTLAARIGRGEV